LEKNCVDVSVALGVIYGGMVCLSFIVACCASHMWRQIFGNLFIYLIFCGGKVNFVEYFSICLNNFPTFY
jgi:hypothetical protein